MRFPTSSRVSVKHIFSFVFGISIGFSVAQVWMNVATWVSKDKFWSSRIDEFKDIKKDNELVSEDHHLIPFNEGDVQFQKGN
ncbi:hypothetical protein JTE90_029195 [Oedothorax gibbosus]|uniref:Uncharacterized protein n=1 Tax=Oedothorax gibbosus TaxID=931172 RepID=A0AAV6THD9_9ARAC|nr:hypothetical protein JTE90_029195 [Oedothorax gibbosus]